MFEDFELNPMALALAVIAGFISLIVMSKVEVALIFKIGSFVGTTIVSYFVASGIANKG